METLILENLLKKLKSADTVIRIESKPVVIGFDAFLDQIMTLVKERKSTEQYDTIPTITDFGNWVAASAGKSGGLEAITIEKIAGGCSVNQADGLSALGLPVHLYCTSGQEATFDDLRKKIASFTPMSIMPGNAQVYEFEDGKLMFCEFSHFSNFNSNYFSNFLKKSDYLEKCKTAEAISLTSWSAFPFMTNCYDVLLEEVLSKLTHRPYVFIDLADPASRSKKDILALLKVMAGFEKYTKVTLNLNGNEANQLAETLGIDKANLDSFEEVGQLASALRNTISITEVCIHLIKGAVSSTKAHTEWVEGPYCEKPKKSTGAGDRFNAGYTLGSLLGLPRKERLAVATLNSGYFVRNAESASLNDLIAFAEMLLKSELVEEK